MSIILQHVNQKCNALQTFIGLFLHATNTPETVHELLAHVGLAVSTTTTHNAVNTLSKQATERIRTLGKTMEVLYAYDNIDIQLKYSTPTVERPEDTLIHLTSATMIPLSHHIRAEDLRGIPQVNHVLVSPEKLLQIHPEPPIPLSGLTRRDRFNKYIFLRDLVMHAPGSCFQNMRQYLQKPEIIEQIPVIKTMQVPLTTLDINPSTAAGNAEVLASMLHQAGVGDASENDYLKDIGDHTVLVAGDLLTGDRIRSLQDSRSIESTRWRRMEFLKFVMGLFHLKMACADAIWRIYIKACRKPDSSSLIELIGQIRPHETGKFTSGTTFRRMHEAIQHIGIAMRLDCWRLKVKQRNELSLDEFAKSNPSWDNLDALANEICKEYVVNAETLSEQRTKINTLVRDEQKENILLLHRDLLLYEELSYAMNVGDIGRVETCFLPWMWIFHACGKHKYAADMKRYLENVHFIFPKPLRYAAPHLLLFPADIIP